LGFRSDGEDSAVVDSSCACAWLWLQFLVIMIIANRLLNLY
jgi:hypothetical protein